MYEFSLYLHIVAAFVVAYVVLYGNFVRVFRLPSTQLRINMTLLPVMSGLTLVTGNLVIISANYSHLSLWVILTYPLLGALVLINELFLRRKLRNAKNQGLVDINVTIEYGAMSLVVLVLTYLMVFKPT